MALPANINDREMEKFAEPSTGVTAVRVTFDTTLNNKFPTLGQKIMAGSTPVTIASDQSEIKANIFNTAATAPKRATYSTSAVAFATATGATDIFVLRGSTQNVRCYITRVYVSGTQTTGGAVNVTLIKRSADDSGGTSVSTTIVSHDSTDTSSSAAARYYTANPGGLGGAVGTVYAKKLFIPAATALGDELVWTATDFDKPIVLQNSTQVLAVNFSNTTVTGSSITVCMQWYEVA